ncbi:MAG: hypothetical protein WEA56_02040 [Balneolaceae bacterium]
MNKHQVKNLFIFFLIFLPLQYAMVGVIGDKISEPWPAFVFPGFKNVYVYEDGYELSNAVVEIHLQNSEIIELSPKEFFPEIPPSQISGFMRTHFSGREKINSFDIETDEWLLNHAGQFTSQDVNEIHIVWLKKYYSKPRIMSVPDSTFTDNRFELLSRSNDYE